MGCFTALKNRRKKFDQSSRSKSSLSTAENPKPSERTLQSAPPSFRNRTTFEVLDFSHQNDRTRVLSAPSSLYTNVYEQEDGKNKQVGVGPRMAHPLPLPLPPGTSMLKQGSFNSNRGGGLLSRAGPLPLPPVSVSGLRNFSYDEIAAACNNFAPDSWVAEGFSSVTYKASIQDESLGPVTVVCVLPSKQGYKEFVTEMNKIASLEHPLLCKLVGFHAREGSDQRMLVYERLYYGSLDRLLYGRTDGPPLNWSTRMRIALNVAKGLAFLHEEGPFQAMYHEFRSTDVQIDKDFSAKLSCYGCASYDPEAGSSLLAVKTNLAPEIKERALVTPKCNVWSFGILLLEMLTGRENFDPSYPKAEQNLTKLTRAFHPDDCRLSLIMDTKLKGRYPAKAVRIIADIAAKCLEREPSDRPTMRAVVECLNEVQDIKYANDFPLQEPSSVSLPLNNPSITYSPQSNVMAKLMSRSPSLNGIPSRSSVSPPFTQKPMTSLAWPIPLPPRSCASTLSFEDNSITDVRKTISPTRRSTGALVLFT